MFPFETYFKRQKPEDFATVARDNETSKDYKGSTITTVYLQPMIKDLAELELFDWSPWTMSHMDNSPIQLFTTQDYQSRLIMEAKTNDRVIYTPVLDS